MLARCVAAAVRTDSALAQTSRAVDDDPSSWEPRHGLAVVTAAAATGPASRHTCGEGLPYESMTGALAAQPRRTGNPLGVEGSPAPIPSAGSTAVGGVMRSMRRGQAIG